jgi:hypothetical protein
MISMVAIWLFLGTVAAPAIAPMSVCQVRADPLSFSGQTIRVEATAIWTEHGTLLVDGRCPGLRIGLGKEGNKDSSRNSEFRTAIIKGSLKGGKPVVVVVDGIYWYKHARYPGSRLDEYQVLSFVAEKGTK